MDSKQELMHKIKNCLNSLQTYFDIVAIPADNPRVQNLYQACQESLRQLKDYLQRLEQS